MFQLNFCAGWGIFPVFATLLLPACFLFVSTWSDLPVFLTLCSYPLVSSLFPLGAFFRFFVTLLLPACFLSLSTWSNRPVFCHFAPTRLLSLTSHLEQSSVFLSLCSYTLASSHFPLGVIFRFFDTLLLPACFLLLSTWSNLPVFWHFTPARLIPITLHLE